MNQPIFRRFWINITGDPGKDARLLMLGVTCMTVSIFGYTAGSAVFLDKAGAEQIPLVYIIIGVISVPLYAAFGQIVDRFRRTTVLRVLFLSGLACMVFFRWAAAFDTVYIYYAIYIFYFVYLVLLIDLTYPAMMIDYFTSLDLKKMAPFMVMAISAGGLIGGGLAIACSRVMPALDLLALPVFLCLAGYAQAENIARQCRPVGSEIHTAQTEVAQSLKSFPKLVRRYRIILYLSISSFLFSILTCIAEFQAFFIYERIFADANKLAGFIGALMAGQSILQFILVIFLTRPLIQTLGVSKMNLIYPITTLASFVCLAFSFRLPAAVLAHVNYDSIYLSIDKPVYNLNFNAVPHRFVGRIKSLSDGIFYAGGIAIGGGILLIANKYLGQFEITMIGVSLSAVFVIDRVLLSRGYLQGLVTLLMDGSVNFDDVESGFTRLTRKYFDDIRNHLRSEHVEEQLLGIQLAERANQPSEFWEDIEPLLGGEDGRLKKAAVNFVRRSADKKIIASLIALLAGPSPAMKQAALEALVAANIPAPAEELESSRNGDNQVSRLLARLSLALRNGRKFEALALDIHRAEWQPSDAVEFLEILEANGDARLAGLCLAFMKRVECDNVIVAGLKALQALKPDIPEDAVKTASSLTQSKNPAVRSAALNVLTGYPLPAFLRQTASCLIDPNANVRNAAAAALAAYGADGLEEAKKLLLSGPDKGAAFSAIQTLGLIRSEVAENVLFEYARMQYELLPACGRLLDNLPEGEKWHPMRVGAADFGERTVQLVFHILRALGQERTLNAVRRVLYSRDERMRANAVETLSSLDQRRFVSPILPWCEKAIKKERAMARSQGPAGEVQDLLMEVSRMLEALDLWLRRCAKTTLAAVDAAADSRMSESEEEAFMSRLMFLKKVSLFQSLTLDELLLIDSALRQEHFLEGEKICVEGEVGRDLYLILRGSVRVEKLIEGDNRELALIREGEYFGEMALLESLPRSASVTVAENCVLLALDQEQFRAISLQAPEILFQICGVLSARVRDTSEKLAKALGHSTKYVPET